MSETLPIFPENHDIIIETLSPAMKRFVRYYCKHNLIDITEVRDMRVDFSYANICGEGEKSFLIEDNIEKFLFFQYKIKNSKTRENWRISIRPSEVEENLSFKCSFCKEGYSRCPVKIAAYAMNKSQRLGKTVDELLHIKKPAYDSHATNSIVRRLPKVDLITQKIAFLWSDLIKIEDASDDFIEYSYVKNDMLVGKFIWDTFFNPDARRIHKKLNLKKVDKEIAKTNSLISDYNPLIYAVLVKFLSQGNSVLEEDVYYKLLEKIDDVKFKTELYYKFQSAEIGRTFYDPRIKESLISVLDYVRNYHNQELPFIPFNFVLYTTSERTISNITDILLNIFRVYDYLPDVHVKATTGNQIVLDGDIPAKLYDPLENAIVDIRHAEMLNRLHIEKKPVIMQKILSRMLACPKTFTIISGEEKELKPLLMSIPQAYITLFNIKMRFAKFTDELTFDILKDRLKKVASLTPEFQEELMAYIRRSKKESVLTNHDYVENLYRHIVKQYGVSVHKEKKLTADLLPQPKRKRNMDDILTELNDLTGLENIKAEINRLVAMLEFNNKMDGIIERDTLNLHMIFNGNPGTGKTMIARVIAEILYQLGYVKQNKLVEVEAKDLIAGYVGQTALKTTEVLKSALDGVLFIDEAYATTHGGSGEASSYGQDFIATIIKSMEEYKDRLIIIFAGYKNEMDKFIKSNPGLQSRIGYRINFDDYTNEQLKAILKQRFEKADLKLQPKALEKAYGVIKDAAKVENFGNARFAVNLYQDILLHHSMNCRGIEDKEKLRTITPDDVSNEILDKVSGVDKKHLGFSLADEE